MKTEIHLSLAKRWASLTFVALIIWFGLYGAFVDPARLPMENLRTSGGQVHPLFLHTALSWVVLPRILDLFLIPLMVATTAWLFQNAWQKNKDATFGWLLRISVPVCLIGAALVSCLAGTWAGLLMAGGLNLCVISTACILRCVFFAKARRRYLFSVYVALEKVRLYFLRVLFHARPKLLNAAGMCALLGIGRDELRDIVDANSAKRSFAVTFDGHKCSLLQKSSEQLRREALPTAPAGGSRETTLAG